AIEHAYALDAVADLLAVGADVLDRRRAAQPRDARQALEAREIALDREPDQRVPRLTRRRVQRDHRAAHLVPHAALAERDHQAVEACIRYHHVAAAAEQRHALALLRRPAQRRDQLRVARDLREQPRRAAQPERGARRERHSTFDLRQRVDRVQRSTSTPPMYGTSTSGTRTLPSACWYCSSTATSVRPSGRPEPLSVC